MFASSSSSSPDVTQPQVFINFRGEDVRYDFLDFLVDKMKSENINVFIDKNEVRGLGLQNLLVRIKQSKIAIAIFSKSFTNSEWCLNELVEIYECVGRGSLIAIPVFYKLEASDVKDLEGDFGTKFRALKRMNRHDKLKTEKWEEAIASISEYHGMALHGKMTDIEFVDMMIFEVKKSLKYIAESSEQSSEPVPIRQSTPIPLRQSKSVMLPQSEAVEVVNPNINSQVGILNARQLTISNLYEARNGICMSVSESSKFGTMAMVLGGEVKGGEGGYEWDDGYDYDDITKIHVQGDRKGIQFISFEYVKAGEPIVGPVHGVSGDGSIKTFEINYLEKECLVAVDGYYDESTGVIQSIQFTTNTKTSGLMGLRNGTKFSLRSTKRKIIGFHGFADKNLNSLGAYFIKVSIKSELVGSHSRGGSPYDDGVHYYDGIRKLYIGHDDTQIRYLKIDYDKAGRVESIERGDNITPIHEFAVDYPNEYITSVEGTYGTSATLIVNKVTSDGTSATFKVDVVTSLFFKTSKGRHSPMFGRISGTKFVLESPGNVIVGFYGRFGSAIDGMGAYFSLPPTPITKVVVYKEDVKGGLGRNEWDDGSNYEGVTKIHVRGAIEGIKYLRVHVNLTYIRFIKIEYIKAGQTIVGPIHGVSGEGFTQSFEIKHSNGEFLVFVDGYCNESTCVIQSIQCTTNKEIFDLIACGGIVVRTSSIG